MLLAMRRGYVGISSGLATIETQARDWPLASFDFEAARDLLDRPRRRDAMDALADGSHKGEGSPVMEAPKPASPSGAQHRRTTALALSINPAE
jgi:hypothetical protein